MAEVCHYLGLTNRRRPGTQEMDLKKQVEREGSMD